MSRMQQVSQNTQVPEQREALDALRGAWGGIWNLSEVLAASLPATRGLLALETALEQGRFTGAAAEQIAIAVAHQNGCRYCLAAHSAAGRVAGLSHEDVRDAQLGRASDPAVQAALTFVRALIREQGWVSDQDLDAVRGAGYSDGDVVELLAHAIGNSFTNYIHHLSDVPIDFQPVEPVEEETAVSE